MNVLLPDYGITSIGAHNLDQRRNMTRMWMVDPEIMCQQHLLGEHFESHVIATNIKRGRGIAGFIKINAIEPQSVKRRHDELVSEMERRGMKHNSPLDFTTDIYPDFKIDREVSLKLLVERCPRCAERLRSRNDRKAVQT